MDSLVTSIPSANLCKVLHSFVDICIRKQNFAELTPVHPSLVRNLDGSETSPNHLAPDCKPNRRAVLRLVQIVRTGRRFYAPRAVSHGPARHSRPAKC